MRKLSYLLSVTILSFGLILGCKDNSTAPDEDPPSLPDLLKAQPNISYFQTSSFKSETSSSSDNFAEAQGLVLGFHGISTIGQIYTGFMQGAQGNTPTFEDGVWEWNYTYTYAGSSANVRLTAEPSTSSTSWELYLSVQTPEVSFTDYNMMSGTTQNDGKQGSWTFNTIFNDVSTEQPLVSSSWNIISDTETEIDITVYGNQGSTIATVNYSKTGSEHLMAIDYTDTTLSDVDIFWDSQADVGYVQDNSGKRCWQGSGTQASDVDCSTVGL